MDNLTDIISGAVADAQDSGDGGGGDDGLVDTGAGDGGDGAPVVEGAEGAGAGEGIAGAGGTGVVEVSPSSGTAAERAAAEKVITDKAAAEKLKEPDTIDKLLEAEGIKRTVDDKGRENRIPHSRTKKIISNALAKQTETHTTELKARDTQIETLSKRAATMDNVDRLIATDPDRYIQTLAAIHPDKYGKFVKGGQVETAQPKVAQPVAATVMPPPDVKFTDGSEGYSPEQMQKRDEWLIEQGAIKGAARAQTEFDKRFGPMEKEWKDGHADAQRAPQIKAQIEDAKATWGKPFEDDYNLVKEGKSEILKTMQANDGQEGRPFLNFDQCCAKVLIPRIRADQNAMREKLLAEINGRPAAATRVPAASTKAAEHTGPRTTEDVIRDSIAAAGLRA